LHYKKEFNKGGSLYLLSFIM